MTSKKNSSSFWLGFIIAIILVVAISIYFYQGNKDKKLKDIKKEIENYFKKHLNLCTSKKATKIKKVTKKAKPAPKKFISKK